MCASPLTPQSSPFDLATALQRRRGEGLYRRRRVIEAADGPRVRIDGRELTAFCSNDYLGLSGHPRIVAAWQRGAERWGVGAGAAHLVSGHTAAHRALEEELAEFLGRPRALLFSTGYMANLGTVAALTGRGDRVLEDRLNHASLLDAGLASGARFERYRHADVRDLKARLRRAAGGRTLVASDGVFSMDGDRAPVAELAAAAAEHGAWLMVDDAHGFGVLGPQGRGSAAELGLDVDRVPVLMATLGKAAGTFGAFVSGTADLVDTLVQNARTFVYTTAPPAALAEASREALRLVAEADEARARLRELVARLRGGAADLGLGLAPSQTPIQPLILGDPRRALDWAQALEQRGLLVTAIRPPTVPRGSARLRITLSAAHRDEDVDRLLEALADIAREEADGRA